MARERDCDAVVRQGRLARARAFLDAAALVADLIEGDEQAEEEPSAALVTQWVHAGIAAADVICCVKLGRHHLGDNHTAAVQLLQAADGDSARSLNRLLAVKTQAGYGYQLVSSNRRKQARRAAEALVQRAEELNP